MSQEDKEYRQSVDAFTDQLIEGMELAYHSELEPFQRFADQQRAILQEALATYRERFAEGYVAILREIKQEKLREGGDRERS